ncbi:MAG: cytidylate kinase-like family protein [Lachnospiraceae bacterium]|nr:cytidylate kinase-like family protein [Lachnospiraceae bacterium]
MENRIITISREFGSGGREIGRMVAEKLGIVCYDSDLIQRIVEKSGLKADYVKEGGEDTVGGWFTTFLADRTIGKTEQDKLWSYQSQVISELADKESCVIVGRCADYILRARADCLTVFIHADPEKRAERAVREYGESEENVQKRVRDKDKRRAAYYQFYTDMKWGEARNYHVCLDSGELGIEKCAEIIAQLY